jgi:cytochrome c oxidase assembly protein subunit 11
MISNKFFKTLIYILLGILLIIFFMIQPYNIYCRVSKKCHPVIISSLLWHKSGKEKLQINFTATTPEHLKNIVEFSPNEQQKEIINGKNITNFYQVKNLSNQEITIRAHYNLNPAEADKYLDRIECLCFQTQILKAKEEVNMPLNFRIKSEIENDSELKNLQKITVNYEVMLVQ